MKKPFSKIAIVTGASRGIGAAISRRLAADGFGVIINYAASADAAESLATEIEKAGSRALAVKGMSVIRSPSKLCSTPRKRSSAERMCW
jgi:3-oxoacyl-[acyl-carrier protein] reductase